MRVSATLGAAIAALLTSLPVGEAAPRSLAALLRPRATVQPPSQDPFYKPPKGFEKTAPGTILRSRQIDVTLTGTLPLESAYQLLYRTTDIDGCAISTVTTIFKPPKPQLDRFVSYATAYDSSATECDPSYSYRLPENLANATTTTDAEYLIISGYLNQGYIVSSPDYEGPQAAFTPGHLEGMCVLDNMRAVTNFGKTLGFTTPHPAIVGQGYSGGAIATGWAASLQPEYAPELPVKGWAHGGTPANLTGVTVYIDNTSNSGYLVAAVAGLAKSTAYKRTLQPVLDKILTVKGRQAVQYGDSHCASQVLDEYPNTSLQSYEFQTLGPAIFDQPVVKKIFQDNLMGGLTKETPKAPVLMYHSLQDEIIPYANASALAQRWCSRGASVNFSTYQKGTHAETAVNGLSEVYAFVASAFAGLVPQGCSRPVFPQ